MREAGGKHRDPNYEGDQFAFVDDENSGDVVDWLSFAETRAERAAERRRRNRTRLVALVAVVVLVGLGLGGYGVWRYLGAVAADSAPRATLLFQLRDGQGKATTSALLVRNAQDNRGFALYVPQQLVVEVPGQGAQRFEDAASLSWDALGDLLGVGVEGAWTLDATSLAVLVDSVGGIELTTDLPVRAATTGNQPAARTLPPGPQRLAGAQAVEYVTAAKGPPEARTNRFHQVLRTVLGRVPTDTELARTLLHESALSASSTLPEPRLAAFLAGLSGSVAANRYLPETLPVHPAGTLDLDAAGPLVHRLFGSSVRAVKENGLPRVAVRDATGVPTRGEDSRFVLLNAGYRIIDAGRTPSPEARSVVYVSEEDLRPEAVQVALTLGLTADAVRYREDEQAVARVVVSVGRDYRG